MCDYRGTDASSLSGALLFSRNVLRRRLKTSKDHSTLLLQLESYVCVGGGRLFRVIGFLILKEVGKTKRANDDGYLKCAGGCKGHSADKVRHFDGYPCVMVGYIAFKVQSVG